MVFMLFVRQQKLLFLSAAYRALVGIQINLYVQFNDYFGRNLSIRGTNCSAKDLITTLCEVTPSLSKLFGVASIIIAPLFCPCKMPDFITCSFTCVRSAIFNLPGNWNQKRVVKSNTPSRRDDNITGKEELPCEILLVLVFSYNGLER